MKSTAPPNRPLLLLAAAALCLAASGCANLADPVQPWEKGKLAKPEMAFDGDPLRQGLMEHVYSSKEASAGGHGVAGGGCGCN
ncbi:DUF4266 domain-containing protein [Roseateles sp. BYS78W]|uniref:DUF4266 domain-containing protein n=1 Tax=Pelomonas candidula TaxID=3299025 RepID=A0ABW7H8W1_9BURK